jgi:hypothetical protein
MSVLTPDQAWRNHPRDRDIVRWQGKRWRVIAIGSVSLAHPELQLLRLRRPASGTLELLELVLGLVLHTHLVRTQDVTVADVALLKRHRNNGPLMPVKEIQS